MAKKDDAYIALIKFVKNKTAETGLMTKEEGESFLRENYKDLNRKALERLFGDVVEPVAMAAGKEPPTLFRLPIEAYFHLLEHEELEEARTSSRHALRVAIGAILISFVTAVASITIQLTSPTDVVIASGQIELALRAADEWRLDQLSVLTDINHHVSTIAADAASQ